MNRQSSDGNLLRQSSNAKFGLADLVKKFPQTGMARQPSQSSKLKREVSMNIPSKRSSRPPEQPRSTWLRFSTSRQTVNNNARLTRRESLAIPGARISGQNRSSSKVDRPTVIQYEPNERGILRCQAWSVPEMSIETIAPSLSSKNKKFKIQYPRRIQYEYKDNYEIYCPRCDLYFHNRNDYIEHKLIKKMKAPYVNKIKEINSKFDLKELEFADDRNTKKMHTKKLKKYFNKAELMEEVRDIRYRAKIARVPRQKRRMTYANWHQTIGSDALKLPMARFNRNSIRMPLRARVGSIVPFIDKNPLLNKYNHFAIKSK